MDRAQLHELLDALLDKLETPVVQQESREVKLYQLQELAELTQRPVSSLREACRLYEDGKPGGLKCMRETPGKKHSTILVGLDWFAEWRDRQASLNTREVQPAIKARVQRALK
jgi:hypothetical protein